jgi:hypothetical protein
MMELRYPLRSTFYAPIEKAFDDVHDNLKRPLRIELPPGGYNREAYIIIGASDQHTFRTEWESRHPTRFSARIRAAAGVLYRRGFRGRFEAHHHDGTLTLRRADLQK